MNGVVARRLGLQAAEERRLRSVAIARIGQHQYLLRQLAFLMATTPLLRSAIPHRRRPQAIEPLLFALMPDQGDLLAYVRGG
jgi:hypothetical protein